MSKNKGNNTSNNNNSSSYLKSLKTDTPATSSSSSSIKSGGKKDNQVDFNQYRNGDGKSSAPLTVEPQKKDKRSSSWAFWGGNDGGKSNDNNNNESNTPKLNSGQITPNASEPSSGVAAEEMALDDKAKANTNTNVTQKESQANASTPLSTSNINNGYNSDNDARSTIRDYQQESWISWGRRLSTGKNLSSESLRNLFMGGGSAVPGATNTGSTESSNVNAENHHDPNNFASQPKSVVTHDESGKPVEMKSGRSQSWVFGWGSSSSKGDNSSNNRTNTILSEDAILFEASKTKPNDKINAMDSSTSLREDSKKASKHHKPHPPNKIVPNFEEVLPLETVLSKMSNYISYSPPKHLQRISKSKVFKRVLIVGVHGFFPTKMLRPLIGEPTGTSIKFTNEAEKAVLAWARKRNMEISIQKIALEKEGRVFDRVDFFYNIMKKWKDEIQLSDFIFFASHSQGTPVSIILLSKLIQNGIIENDKNDKKIGILAMAGISNGPYYGIDQRFFVRAYSTIENDSMLELFEFQNFDSLQSKKYLESLRIVVNNNVKICFVGSIDDQLVPLYSAIASHIEHPNIYRACYIDGSSNTPNFVSEIVSLSLWLKDIGCTDHGIIKEISNALAGPLTGGGHSRIYNEPKVYELAINFILATNDLNLVKAQPVHFNKFDIKLLNTNPYHLPFFLRGMIFETIKNLPSGREKIDMVLKEFDDWNPDSKVLKDLKYRLSAIKAKL
ncbi:hypothetical protein PACTADRAFT_48560 [Pachysolen tannophilus NRRL Y-2460]|uniref:YMC020W-like alpha/beta hydrolase domain-containing protein n=1 Tax=Pachysolen tannophilus NRRL Y-2460 TaxID=669874 RepID=A0A1E4TYD8_PACTA|nr:hypothetical protein PACTADRAFT_48560 [Pachysolen tannophilus NRRL Y-2460]